MTAPLSPGRPGRSEFGHGRSRAAHPDSDYELPQDVIDKTIAKYKEAYQMLTGKEFH